MSEQEPYKELFEEYKKLFKEANDSNFYDGKPAGKDTLLYKFVEKQAKELGLDMGKEGIRIVIVNSTDKKHIDGAAGWMLYSNKTIYLSQNIFNGDSLPEDFKSTMRHELRHYKDAKDGYYIFDDTKLRAADGGVMKSMKIGECRADFESVGDITAVLSAAFAKEDHKFDNTHQKRYEKLKSLIIASVIEERTGIKLKPDDVKFDDKCNFVILNQEKLRLIPSEVLKEAYKKGEEIERIATGIGRTMRETNTSPVPSLPHNIVPQTEARKGVGP